MEKMHMDDGVAEIRHALSLVCECKCGTDLFQV